MLRDAALKPKSIKDMLLCPHLSFSLFLCKFPFYSADVSTISNCYVLARKWASFFLFYLIQCLSLYLSISSKFTALSILFTFFCIFIYLLISVCLCWCFLHKRVFLKFDGMQVLEILSIF